MTKLIQLSTIMLCTSILAAYNSKEESKKNAHYKEIGTLQEYREIMGSSRPYVLNYHSDRCDACTQMEPLYNDAAKKHKRKISFYTVNLDQPDFKPLIKEQKIEALPTTTFHKDNKEIRRERGSMTKDELNRVLDVFIHGPKGMAVEKTKESETKNVQK